MTIVTSITIISCTRETREESSGVPVIDFGNLQPHRNIDLSEIADIEYIKVETNDSCLLRTDVKYYTDVSDSIIAFSSLIQNAIFFFDRQGNHLGTFNRRGMGPDEYPYLPLPTIDPDSREIILTNSGRKGNIAIYELNGEYKRKQDLDFHGIIDLIYNFNADYLLVRDKSNLSLEPLELNDEEYRYVLIDKNTGKNIKLPIAEKHPIGNCSRIFYQTEAGEPRFWNLKLPYQQILKSGKDFVIADLAKDTIYRVDESATVSPLAVMRNVDRRGEFAPTIVATTFVTDRYLFLETYRVTGISMSGMTFDESEDNQVVYDFKTRQLYPYSIKYPFLKDTNRHIRVGALCDITPANTFLYWLKMENLFEELEKDNLTEPLKTMVEQSDIEDNPILMLITFKE